MFWFFGHKACGILALQPGIKPTPPALEGKVLTTGPPGKSLGIHILTTIQQLENRELFMFWQRTFSMIHFFHGKKQVIPW